MRRLVVMNKKIVFITGISRGIGLEIAKCFVNDGYYVIGTSRSSFSINEELNSENCIHFPIDVTDRNKISSCLEELKKINKIPNVLINNAGITKDQLFLRMKRMTGMMSLILILQVRSILLNYLLNQWLKIVMEK